MTLAAPELVIIELVGVLGEVEIAAELQVGCSPMGRWAARNAPKPKRGISSSPG
jgi:hypothetical protein